PSISPSASAWQRGERRARSEASAVHPHAVSASHTDCVPYMGRRPMTKKHFEWAAAELADARLAGTFDARETHAIKTFCAALFQHFNPRFDWVRFESKVNALVA